MVKRVEIEEDKKSEGSLSNSEETACKSAEIGNFEKFEALFLDRLLELLEVMR